MNTPFKLKTVPNKDRTSRFELFAPHCLDSYKLGHKDQYPKGTEFVYSNFTARSDRHLKVPRQYHDGKLVWMGIHGLLKDMVALWDETFFSKPKDEVLAKYAKRTPAFTGTDPVVSHLAALHDLGYLPIRVKAIKEGSRVNIGVPLFTIVNTKPEFYWLTNALETYLSNEGWKMPTVATIAYTYYKILTDFAEKTGAPKDFVSWQGHCFADRGMSGMMDAAKSNSGHLIPFLGTDSVSSMDYLDWGYKGADFFLGGSVPATEHSVMCIGGKEEEIDTFRRILATYPRGVVSIVSDTWDFWHVMTVLVPQLKDVIMNRQPNEIGLCKTVFRPDSGDPVKILTGYKWKQLKQNYSTVDVLGFDEDLGDVEVVRTLDGKYYEFTLSASRDAPIEIELYNEMPEHVVKGAVEVLWDIFGGTETQLGYKVLDQHVGLIYGDSITADLAYEICQRLMDKGFASCNVVLGIGSFTYQYITRDTLGFAMKATYGMVNGEDRSLFKDPKTDNGVKKSAKGLLKVVKSQEHAPGGGTQEKYQVINDVTWEEEDEGELELIFEDGNFLTEPTVGEIRERLMA